MTKINLKALGLALSLATGFAGIGAGAIAPAAAQAVGANSEIEATWLTDLNTKNATVGQPFKMRITAPASLAGGVIHGHVADVRPGSQGKKAYFTFVADYLTMSNGMTANLTAHFSSTGAKPENTTTRKAVGAGAGMAVGSQTVGRLLGGALGGVVGTLGGAAGGYAYASNLKPNLYVDHGFSAKIVTDSPVYVRRQQTQTTHY